VEATYPAGNDSDPSAYREAETESAVTSFILEVDGERFAVSHNKYGGTHYTWLPGPNKDYGFSSSATPDESLEEHRESIRVFLTQIDPNTGYIEDE
jgi:hypothetical protein